MPQPAKAFHMPVADADASQCGGQCVAVELRIMARTRNRANIHQLLDTVCLQQADELIERTRRMADGENQRL